MTTTSMTQMDGRKIGYSIIFANKNDLLQMLQIADTFTTKLGLAFNDKNLKWWLLVRTIQQIQNGHLNVKCFQKLKLTNNRLLKDTDHIHGHLAETANYLESYIRYTLANNVHVKLKCITPGNTLWQKPVLPALAHRAGVWFIDTWKDNDIQTFRYLSNITVRIVSHTWEWTISLPNVYITAPAFNEAVIRSHHIPIHSRPRQL